MLATKSPKYAVPANINDVPVTTFVDGYECEPDFLNPFSPRNVPIVTRVVPMAHV